jgi:hypothetical protein
MSYLNTVIVLLAIITQSFLNVKYVSVEELRVGNSEVAWFV